MNCATGSDADLTRRCRDYSKRNEAAACCLKRTQFCRTGLSSTDSIPSNADCWPADCSRPSKPWSEPTSPRSMASAAAAFAGKRFRTVRPLILPLMMIHRPWPSRSLMTSGEKRSSSLNQGTLQDCCKQACRPKHSLQHFKDWMVTVRCTSLRMQSRSHPSKRLARCLRVGCRAAGSTSLLNGTAVERLWNKPFEAAQPNGAASVAPTPNPLVPALGKTEARSSTPGLTTSARPVDLRCTTSKYAIRCFSVVISIQAAFRKRRGPALKPTPALLQPHCRPPSPTSGTDQPNRPGAIC